MNDDFRKRVKADLIKNHVIMTPCNCIGPQNGEPACPCAMRARCIFKRDGHWIQPEVDLGPVQCPPY